MIDERHVVKLTRAWGSTILFIGSKSDADAEALRLNMEYQTDEYKVEPWVSST